MEREGERSVELRQPGSDPCGRMVRVASAGMTMSHVCAVAAEVAVETDAGCSGTGLAGTDAPSEIGAAMPNNQTPAVRRFRRRAATISKKYYRWFATCRGGTEARTLAQSAERRMHDLWADLSLTAGDLGIILLMS